MQSVARASCGAARSRAAAPPDVDPAPALGSTRRGESGKLPGMNFLLHRRLALDELGSRPAAVGAMLPDLWRMADRRVRAREEVSFSEASLSELERGVAHHLEADR